jgi:hypothetical protein
LASWVHSLTWTDAGDTSDWPSQLEELDYALPSTQWQKRIDTGIDTAGGSAKGGIPHAASARHSRCVASAGQHESSDTAIPATLQVLAGHPRAEVEAGGTEGQLNSRTAKLCYESHMPDHHSVLTAKNDCMRVAFAAGKPDAGLRMGVRGRGSSVYRRPGTYDNPAEMMREL